MKIVRSSRAGSRSSGRLDRIGAGLGVACALHCLLTPLVLGVLPALGLGVLAHESVERVCGALLLAVAAGNAGWQLYWHGDVRAAGILAAAAALVLGGLWLGHGHALGPPLGVAGALLVAAAHVRGARLHRRCGHE